MQAGEEIEHQPPTSKLAYMYVPRAIDNELWDTFTKWWADTGKRVGWISVESDRGRGNTYLLNHFRHQIEDHPSLGRDVRVVLADAGKSEENDGVPEELPPVAGAVFDEYSNTPLAWTHHLKQWLSGARLIRISIMFGGVFLAFTMSAMIHELGWPLHLLSADFWMKLLQGAQEHGIEVAKDLGIALILALVPELVRWGWESQEESKKESKREKIRSQRLETYRDNGPGLIAGLQDICRGKAALVVLVDNAHALKPTDRELLEKFASRGSASRMDPSDGLRTFKANFRVIIVTLDFQRSASHDSSPISKVLSVEPFTRVELRQILEHSGPPADSNGSGEWMLDMAAQNVKAIYLEQNFELRKRLEKEFMHPPRVGIKGIFGFRDLTALCAVRPEPAPTTGDLFERVENLDPRVFGLKKPQDVQNLCRGVLLNAFIAHLR